MALLTSLSDDETLSSSSSSASSTPPPSSPAARAKAFWRFLCQMDEEALKVDDVSLDKLEEMMRILNRCLENVDVVIKKQNAGN